MARRNVLSLELIDKAQRAHKKNKNLAVYKKTWSFEP
jgi:hypothetical protein|tara:strand:- start:123 stop:233 length:111 start_codon:yes stop_codon:yes gene_type:complete